LLDQVEGLVPLVETGPFSGRAANIASSFPNLGKILGVSEEERKNAIELEALVRNLQAQFQRAVSGATVPEQEVRRLAKILPQLTDTPDEISIKIRTLRDEMLFQRSKLKDLVGAVGPSNKEVRVVRKSDGVEGVIPENEIDLTIYKIIE